MHGRCSMKCPKEGCGSAFSNKRYKIRVAGFDVKVVRIFGPVMYDMIVQMDFANTSIVQIDHVFLEGITRHHRSCRSNDKELEMLMTIKIWQESP
ncbi:hypothetical protein LXL04_016071 [Taraxacum kok-saghyz]